MKNNILKLFLIIFINNFINFSAYSTEQFNFNVTETHDYISKFKIIIDSVCGSFINCTSPK